MYRHFTGTYYSEAVKQMADDRGAHWLIDAIASHRANPLMKPAREKDPRFHDMEIWVLEDHGESGVVLKAVPDTTAGYLSNPVIEQKIQVSDFDFKGESSYKLYCGWTEVPNDKGGTKPGFYIYHPDEY